MGREQRRREQFKNKNKKLNEEDVDTSIKLTTVIKLVSFIIIFLFVIYYVLAIFVTKELDIVDKNKKSTITEQTEADTTLVSGKILASSIFEQKEDDYYVYFYDFNEEDELVKGVINTLTEEKVYKVDTSSSLNANYVTEEKGNKKAKSVKELKVVSPTVIRVKADKIVEYYEGSNDIYENLTK